MSCSRNFTAVVGVTYIFCRNAVLSQRMIPVLDGTIEGVDKTAADHADTFVPVVINFYKFPVCKFSVFGDALYILHSSYLYPSFWAKHFNPS